MSNAMSEEKGFFSSVTFLSVLVEAAQVDCHA